VVGEKRTIDEPIANNSADKRVCVENPYSNQSILYYGLQV
jgi:hypothetical protein